MVHSKVSYGRTGILILILAGLLLFAPSKRKHAALQQAGVARLIEGRSSVEAVLYGSKHYFKFQLIDKTGQVLQRWTAVPKEPVAKIADWHPGVGRAVLQGQRVYVQFPYSELQVYDKKNVLRESYAIASAGGFVVRPDETIHVLAFTERVSTAADDSAAVLLPDLLTLFRGEIVQRTDLASQIDPLLKPENIAEALERCSAQEQVQPYNLYRPTAVRIISKDFNESWKRGDIIIAFENIDLLVLLDAKSKRVKWSVHGGFVQAPSDILINQNGHLTVLTKADTSDNAALFRFNPMTKMSEWIYSPSALWPFAPKTGGHLALLPTGLLAADSAAGSIRALESGQLLTWYFRNPASKRSVRLKENADEVAEIAFMQAVNAEALHSFTLDGVRDE